MNVLVFFYPFSQQNAFRNQVIIMRMNLHRTTLHLQQSQLNQVDYHLFYSLAPEPILFDSISHLMDQVLGEAKTVIAEMKLKLLEALNGDGSLLTELVPNLGSKNHLVIRLLEVN
jgi:hypothetical protein